MNTIPKTAEGEGLKDDASNYDKNAYEKPSVTVDVAICQFQEGELKVLLIKRKNPPFRDSWAIPGGFVDIPAKETLEITAARELEEETGLRDMYVEQLKTYGDPDRDPRMRVITVAYFALVRPESLLSQHIEAKSDAKEWGWFSLNRLPQLAFDHKKILGDLMERLSGKVSYTPIAFNLLNKKFIFRELQDIYEFLLGRKILGPNFRRKILSMYTLKQIKEVRELPNGGRPAAQFVFKNMKTVRF